MNRRLFLFYLLGFFSLISILILKSIAPSLVDQQLIFFFLGFVLLFVLSKLDFGVVNHYSGLLYLAVIGLLVLTLLIGVVTKGSTRWIDIGSLFHIQPSQLAIPITSLFLAKIITRKDMNKVKNILQILGLLLVPAVLILIEPDLGTTVVYLLSVGTVLFFSNLSLLNLSKIVVLFLMIGVASWLFVLKPYQKQRIFTFLNTQQDLSDTGYNARQSMVAVGSGKFFGRGVGQGVQSHLQFLPERQTDFIFASLAEELGFLGSSILILAYVIFIAYLLFTAYRCQNQVLQLYCLSLVVMIAFQIFVNIGMNMSLVPITGVTLPLISYGGSSILSIFLSLSVVLMIRDRDLKITTRSFT